jgi:chromosome segregation ATPase
MEFRHKTIEALPYGWLDSGLCMDAMEERVKLMQAAIDNPKTESLMDFALQSVPGYAFSVALEQISDMDMKFDGIEEPLHNNIGYTSVGKLFEILDKNVISAEEVLQLANRGLSYTELLQRTYEIFEQADQVRERLDYDIATTKEIIRDLNAKADSLFEELEHVRSRSHDDVIALDDEIRTIEQETNSLNGELDRLEYNIDLNESEIKENEQEITQLESEIESLKTSSNIMENEISDLVSKQALYDKESDEFFDLGLNIHYKKVDISELKQKRNELDQQINNILSENESIKTIIDELFKQIDVIKEKQITNDYRIEDLVNKIADIEDSFKADILQAESEIEEKKDELDALIKDFEVNTAIPNQKVLEKLQSEAAIDFKDLPRAECEAMRAS